METSAMFYVFSALALGGALGVVFVRGYVNAAMSMLLAVLGFAGLLIMMQAYLVGLLMVMVYAGAILVLFVFIAMLVGDGNARMKFSARLKLMAMWALLVGVLVWLAQGSAELYAPARGGAESLAEAKNYGWAIFTKYMLHFQIAGALLLAAMVGVIVLAKENFAPKKYKRDML